MTEAVERIPQEEDPVVLPTRRWPLWVPVLIGVLIGAFYPLSYGLVKYHESMGRLHSFGKFIDVFYAPIEWFAYSSDFGGTAVDWLRRLWGAPG